MKHFTKLFNYSKKIIQITLIVFFLIQTQACNESPNNPVERESFSIPSKSLQKNGLISDDKFDKVVNHISKSLAIMLNDKSVREILAAEMQNSTHHHKIIDCLSLLNEDITVNSKSVKLLDKLLEIIDENDKNDFKNYITNMANNYLFLGFPSKEHMNRWFESGDILVAAVGDRLDGDESDVTAYNIKGKKINLVADKLPPIPTMVVRTDKPFTKKSTVTLLPGDDGGGGGGSTSTQYNVYINGFEVGTDHEGFFDWNGMEIYFKVSARPANGTWGPWETVTNPIEGFEEDVYKSLGWYGVNIFYTSVQNYQLRIQAWDSDDGSADDGSPDYLVAKVY